MLLARPESVSGERGLDVISSSRKSSVVHMYRTLQLRCVCDLIVLHTNALALPNFIYIGQPIKCTSTPAPKDLVV